MPVITSYAWINELLAALSEQLGVVRARHELIVIGGAGVLALGVIDRPTGDVDVVALRVGGDLVKADSASARGCSRSGSREPRLRGP